MFRKIVSISLVLALLIAILPGSAAFASTSTETTADSNRYGKVKAVTADSIIITNLGGAQKTILVNSATKFYRFNGAKRALSDVKVKSWIFASGTVDSARNLVASVVVLVKSKYVTAAYWDYPREYGTVISVNPAYGVFFLKTDKSGIVKAIGYENTRFLNPKVKKVSQISLGMKVVVTGPKQSNGYILSTIIIAFTPARR